MFKFGMKDRKTHWEDVYQKHRPNELGWYQESPDISLRMIESTGVDEDGRIIDVGGGASPLIELLVARGSNVTVLDISSTALEEAKKRLGEASDKVKWIVADITKYKSTEIYDIWHDRAVFHFLTSPQDRKEYVACLNSALRVGGYLVISTFGPAGPRKCAGLRTMRYSPESLHKEIGDNFHLAESGDEIHLTPTAKEQEFIYCVFKKCQ
jgi:2-polyprenyl-3-methyl-5-hydroxy-6-metoxy-1,4-benzoquinol methylase